MRTIIISIRPEWVAKILNGEKTIEVRKGLALYNALKKAEERGEEVEFLMYVTKDPKHPLARFEFSNGARYEIYGKNTHYACGCSGNMSDDLNGKVVARFKAKAERIEHRYHRTLDDWDGYYIDRSEKINIREIELCELSCLNREQLDDYLQGKEGTALHISNIDPFDKPKDLADYGLKRAPQSWAYAKEAL